MKLKDVAKTTLFCDVCGKPTKVIRASKTRLLCPYCKEYKKIYLRKGRELIEARMELFFPNKKQKRKGGE